MLSILPSSLGCEFTTHWSGPLDGRALRTDLLAGYGFFPWKIPSTNPWWNRPLKKGEIGCAINHWLCWLTSDLTKDSPVLILEDDVYLPSDFSQRLEDALELLAAIDPSWDLLYLGRVPLRPDAPVTDSIVRPGYSHCTFAYVITNRCARKLIATSFNSAIIPVDEFLPAMYIDHPRDDVRVRYRKTLSAYALEPSLVSQLAKSNAGSDTEDTDFIQED
jgi:collagen beta-1,O-galactosyltransferase